MPTIEEVCNSFDLTDVDIEFTDDDFQNLTTYKLFQQHVRPILQKENPKVPMSKLMMLVAAKWREFSESNPHLQEETKEEDESPPRSPEYTPKPSRSRSSKAGIYRLWILCSGNKPIVKVLLCVCSVKKKC